MRDIASIARRLLEVRATARRLQGATTTLSSASATAALSSSSSVGGSASTATSRALVMRAAAHALAWALEVDLNTLDTPALTGLPDAPTVVTLYPLDFEDAQGTTRLYWLMEVPAHVDAADAGCSTEAWSAFLSDQQARELRAALARALTTPLTPAPSSVPSSVTLPTLKGTW